MYSFLSVDKRADDAYDITDGSRRISRVRMKRSLLSYEWRVDAGEAGMAAKFAGWEKRKFKTAQSAIAAFFKEHLV